jgi:hypothetical protein
MLRVKHDRQNPGFILTKIVRFFMMLALLTAATHSPTARAQGTAEGTPFLHRGRLSLDGTPANGAYDLTFSLFDTAAGGTPAARPITNSAVKVRNGMYAVTLDFGPGPFTGTNYWLDINVRTNGGGVFAELSPRHQLAPSPYAHGPRRIVTSVMRLPQSPDASKHPEPDAGPGAARDESSSPGAAVPAPKPGTSQNP